MVLVDVDTSFNARSGGDSQRLDIPGSSILGCEDPRSVDWDVCGCDSPAAICGLVNGIIQETTTAAEKIFDLHLVNEEV